MPFISNVWRICFIFAIFLIKTQNKEIDFCESNKLSSVFNIDKDIHLVGVENNINIYWKYEFNSNYSIAIALLIKELNFRDDSPVYAFKFSEVYECSKDIDNCRNNDYKFEGIEHCVQYLEYCKNLVKLQDKIFLIGYNLNGKQLYQALKQDQNGFNAINNSDEMPFGWRPKSELSNGNKLWPEKDMIENSLIAIVFIRSRYELALVIKSKTKLVLKHTSLRDKDWFKEHKWKDVEIFDFGNQDIIGMFEKDQRVYAVIKSNENQLFEYKVSGPHGFSRQFIEQENSSLKSLFKCDKKISHSSSSTSSSPTKDVKDIPQTSIWEYVIIPAIIVIFAFISCIIFGFWYKKSKRNAEKSRRNSRKTNIRDILKTPSNRNSQKKANKF